LTCLDGLLICGLAYTVVPEARAVGLYRNPAFFPNPAPAQIPPEPDTFTGFGKYAEVRPFQ